jgi:hypothetical protein
MSDDSAPSIEIDAEPTEANQTEAAPSHSKTMPHATVEWLAGFEEGRARGASEMLEALGAALSDVGVPPEVAQVIVGKVRARGEKTGR